MTCALCGAKAHNVRTCPLPGRDRYLKAQEHARKIHSWSKQPQKGRKPPRLGGVNKKFKKQRAVQYSGAKKVELQKKIRNQNRKKTASLPQTLESQRAAVDTLQRLGFLQELPRICTTCRRGTFGESQITSTQQVFWRCIDSDCRKRVNVLDLASWLPDGVRRRGYSPFQLCICSVSMLLCVVLAQHRPRPRVGFFVFSKYETRNCAALRITYPVFRPLQSPWGSM